MSRKVTSKDTHSVVGELLVVYSELDRVDQANVDIAKVTTSVLGFKSPSFSFGTDIVLPADTNHLLRDVLLSEKEGASGKKGGRKRRVNRHKEALLLSESDKDAVVLGILSDFTGAYIPEVLLEEVIYMCVFLCLLTPSVHGDTQDPLFSLSCVFSINPFMGFSDNPHAKIVVWCPLPRTVHIVLWSPDMSLGLFYIRRRREPRIRMVCIHTSWECPEALIGADLRSATAVSLRFLAVHVTPIPFFTEVLADPVYPEMFCVRLVPSFFITDVNVIRAGLPP